MGQCGRLGGGLILVRKVLPFGETERAVPVVMIEVDLGGGSGSNGVEPIVEYHVVLGGDLPRFEAQHLRYSIAMFGAGTHIHVAGRPSTPTGQFLPVGQLAVQDVHRTAPHMKVVELRGQVRLATEQFEGGYPVVFPGHSIQDVDRVEHGKGPELNIGDVRPVDCLVVEHRSSN